jgi:hypothetical protein
LQGPQISPDVREIENSFDALADESGTVQEL